MTYLDEVAAAIEHELPGELVPDDGGASLFRLYALLALAKGRAVTAADVHNAWAAWTQERNPAHRSLKPFEQLDPETQASDEPFVHAIRTVGEALERAPA